MSINQLKQHRAAAAMTDSSYKRDCAQYERHDKQSRESSSINVDIIQDLFLRRASQRQQIYTVAFHTLTL